MSACHLKLCPIRMKSKRARWSHLICRSTKTIGDGRSSPADVCCSLLCHCLLPTDTFFCRSVPGCRLLLPYRSLSAANSIHLQLQPIDHSRHLSFSCPLLRAIDYHRWPSCILSDLPTELPEDPFLDYCWYDSHYKQITCSMRAPSLHPPVTSDTEPSSKHAHCVGAAFVCWISSVSVTSYKPIQIHPLIFNNRCLK